MAAGLSAVMDLVGHYRVCGRRGPKPGPRDPYKKRDENSN